jgi:hypothetical protein
MEPIESVAKKVVSARETRVGSILGPHVVQQAKDLAAEVGKEHGLAPDALLEFTLWGAMRVQDFLDPTHTLPEKFYSCRTCWDTGFQVIEERPGKSHSRACLACQKGISILASDWLPVIRPVGRHGKRYDSHEGRDHFAKAFRHLPTLREKLELSMQYLEKREGGGRE